MLIKNLQVLLISPFLSPLLPVEAQSGSTIAVGPPLTCDLTTFTCPRITNGCCTIDGCCGTGCCALGYKCINEGTSDQACCSVYDPTLCGTKSSPPPDTGSGGGRGGSGGVDKTCTQIHNCRDSSTGQTWTCLLGQTCSLYYRGCYPCSYAGGSGGGGEDFSSSTDTPSDTSTSSPGTEVPTGTSTTTATDAGAAVTATKAPSMGTLSWGDGIGNTWVLFLVWLFGYLYALA